MIGFNPLENFIIKLINKNSQILTIFQKPKKSKINTSLSNLKKISIFKNKTNSYSTGKKIFTKNLKNTKEILKILTNKLNKKRNTKNFLTMIFLLKTKNSCQMLILLKATI